VSAPGIARHELGLATVLRSGAWLSIVFWGASFVATRAEKPSRCARERTRGALSVSQGSAYATAAKESLGSIPPGIAGAAESVSTSAATGRSATYASTPNASGSDQAEMS